MNEREEKGANDVIAFLTKKFGLDEKTLGSVETWPIKSLGRARGIEFKDPNGKFELQCAISVIESPPEGKEVKPLRTALYFRIKNLNPNHLEGELIDEVELREVSPSKVLEDGKAEGFELKVHVTPRDNKQSGTFHRNGWQHNIAFHKDIETANTTGYSTVGMGVVNSVYGHALNKTDWEFAAAVIEPIVKGEQLAPYDQNFNKAQAMYEKFRAQLSSEARTVGVDAHKVAQIMQEKNIVLAKNADVNAIGGVLAKLFKEYFPMNKLDDLKNQDSVTWDDNQRMFMIALHQDYQVQTIPTQWAKVERFKQGVRVAVNILGGRFFMGANVVNSPNTLSQVEETKVVGYEFDDGSSCLIVKNINKQISGENFTAVTIKKPSGKNDGVFYESTVIKSPNLPPEVEHKIHNTLGTPGITKTITVRDGQRTESVARVWEVISQERVPLDDQEIVLFSDINENQLWIAANILVTSRLGSR